MSLKKKNETRKFTALQNTLSLLKINYYHCGLNIYLPQYEGCLIYCHKVYTYIIKNSPCIKAMAIK